MKKTMVMAALVALSSFVFADTVPELEKAFDKAISSGRPLTAERAYTQLREKGAKLSPARYRQAAEVARQLGKYDERNARLAHYLKVEKKWDADAVRLAYEMCFASRNADVFVMLCARKPSPRQFFEKGLELLGEYVRGKRAADFKMAAMAMLGNYEDGASRNAIYGYVYEMLANKVPGFTMEEARSMIEKYPSQNNEQVCRIININRDKFSSIWRLKYMASRPSCVLDDNTFGYVLYLLQGKGENEVKQRIEAAKYLSKIKPYVVDGRKSDHAVTFFKLRVGLKKQLFADEAAQSADLFALFETIANSEKAPSRDKMAEILRYALDNGAFAKADVLKIRAKYPSFVTPNNNMGKQLYLEEECFAAKSSKPITDFLAKIPSKYAYLKDDVRYQMLRTYAKVGDAEAVKKILMQRLKNTGRREDLHYDYVISSLGDLKLTDKQLAEMLTAVYNQCGWHDFYDFCARHRKGAEIFKGEAVKSFFEKANTEKKQSPDKMVVLSNKIRNMRHGQGLSAPAGVHEVFAEACKLYPGLFPSDKRADYTFDQIFGRYVDLCQYDVKAATTAIDAILAKVDRTKPSAWVWCFGDNVRFISTTRNKTEGWRKALIARAQAEKSLACAHTLTFPQKTDTLPFDSSIMGADVYSCARMLYSNWDPYNERVRYFTPRLAAEIVQFCLLKYDAVKNNSWVRNWWYRDFFSIVQSVYNAGPENFKNFNFDKGAALYLDGKRDNDNSARRYLRLCVSAGKGDKYIKQFVAAIASRPTYEKLNVINSLCADKAISYIEKGSSEKGFGWLVKNHLLPILKEMPNTYAPLVNFGEGAATYHRMGDWIKETEKQDWDLRRAFCSDAVRLLTHGAAGFWGDNGVQGGPIFVNVYTQALNASNAVEMAKIAYLTGRKMRVNYGSSSVGFDNFTKLSNGTADQKLWECLYLLTSSMVDGDKNVISLVARHRAEASKHLPGVYPVSERDPLYPLYVAADELQRNNAERATTLLMRNITVFERDAINLPPEFTAWAVDQMRIARGKNDSLLLKARTLASRLLQEESRLSAELAAALVLVKAECYRDQQNFEVAKLEYDTIRNNPVYSKTKSGRKAMFRAIDLMIEMGNAASTESTLEYWLSQPDAEIQAQAHYFLARIAFDKKDYDECRKRLKEVFSIDFTHTDGRFLEGRWKLATGNEVDDTEVMIGDISDRKVIRPGQQLAISVQDRNLSVAGGGASIPVVVTTVPGGDRERIYLYPTPRDPTLFRGFIDVKLAETVVSNLTIEVTGNDIVSYNIDKEFLLARGLPIPAPKRLSVVDDARLIVGTGSPRTDEEKDKKKVNIEEIIDSADLTSYRAPSLRPGNPLYVAVMDKDCSMKGESAVTVKVSTSSGDVLENVEMKEVRPFSGIFRGEIPTSLPPPRAFASDTAVGFNPGDIISTKRNGGWKSLDDAKKGKWFSVDTMGSHLFSNIVVKMSSPEELRRLRLTGRIGGDIYDLAQFPAASAEGRTGLRQWRANVHNVRGEHGVRTHFSSSSAKSYVVSNITCKGVSQWNGPYISYFKGAFAVGSENEQFRLRITPLESGSVMTKLWFSVMIDGKPFFSGFGPTLANHIISRKLSHGCHLIEVFSVQHLASDAWELSWYPSNGEAAPIPASWFDVAAHPEISEFLTDKATVVRTEEGFNVTFREPMRLRSFTIDFLEHLAPGVQLDKISATDWDGKTIVPVETDFSDAQRNSTLEVAPGDSITVAYTDKSTTSGKQKIVSKSIGSSFNDASVAFYFEHVVTHAQYVSRFCNSAYRFMPGDTLLVGVSDKDLDVSEEADKVDVVVESSNGEKRTITLHEQAGYLGPGGEVRLPTAEMEGVHSGFFLGLLKTRTPDQTNASVRAAFPCTADDTLKVSYVDRENTRPGVPFVRTASVSAARPTTPVVTLFHARNKKVVDNSVAAKARLAALRRRAGNEKVEKLYKKEVLAYPMTPEESSSTNPIAVNVSAPLLIRVNDPSCARHSKSYLVMEAVTAAEVARAEVDGDEPDVKKCKIRLGGHFQWVIEGIRLLSGAESVNEALAAGSFNGAVKFSMGEIDSSEIVAHPADQEEFRPIHLAVTGSDKVHLTIKTSDGKVIAKRTISFVSDAALSLVDSSWLAERNAVHVGESFYIKIEDADRDTSDEPDTVELDVQTTGGTRRKAILTETLPHSGVFTGSIKPFIFPPSEKIPEVTTSVTASVEETLADNRLPVKFGENIVAKYFDKLVLPGSEPKSLCVTGMVYKGSDGSLRLFSKRFRTSDDAVLVQFRLAECLFEQAKDFRKLKQMEKSADSIAKGRAILEEALKNNPQSSHVAQGEFLLANLYQELAAEEDVLAKSLRKEGDAAGAESSEKKARLLYAEALARFSSILAVWPEGEYAPRAQYHKAYCLEMLKDFKLAGEEYVKMTYMYPESDLVGDATIRLATYYFREEKKYSTAARIYESFARRFPNHDKAARSLFMCGSCYIKQGEAIMKAAVDNARKEAEKKKIKYREPLAPPEVSEMYARAVTAFVDMTEKYAAVTTPELRAQGLYWAGDASLRKDDPKAAYIFLKRTVLEYPETEWARRARGLMLQKGKAFKNMD